MSRPILHEGDKVTLPDGRVITFLEVNVSAMDDPCYGCVLAEDDCTYLDSITGPCGSGRPDGKLGIFIEIEEDL